MYRNSHCHCVWWANGTCFDESPTNVEFWFLVPKIVVLPRGVSSPISPCPEGSIRNLHCPWIIAWNRNSITNTWFEQGLIQLQRDYHNFSDFHSPDSVCNPGCSILDCLDILRITICDFWISLLVGFELHEFWASLIHDKKHFGLVKFFTFGHKLRSFSYWVFV